MRTKNEGTHGSGRHVREDAEVQVLLAVVQALDDPLALRLPLEHGQAGQIATEVVLELQLLALPAGAHYQFGGVHVVALVQRPVVNLLVVGLVCQEEVAVQVHADLNEDKMFEGVLSGLVSVRLLFISVQ